MAELIIPGTYIDVRAEGLISAGGVATGIVGVVGTANSGPVGVPVTLSGYSEARETFGLPDDFAVPYDGSHPLTLTRALQLAYANGATKIVAVRVASPRAAKATYVVKDGLGNPVATLTAATSGSWGNEIQVSVGEATAPSRIVGEKVTKKSDMFTLAYPTVVPGPQNRIQVERENTRKVETFDLVYRTLVVGEKVAKVGNNFQLAATPVSNNLNAIKVLDDKGAVVITYPNSKIIIDTTITPKVDEVRINPSTRDLVFEADQAPTATQSVVATYAVDHDLPKAGQILVTVWNGILEFYDGEKPTAGDTLTASYLVEAADSVLVTLSAGQTKESYLVPDGNALASAAANSSLVSVVADSTHGNAKPATSVPVYFGTGGNLAGADGADAGQDEYGAGLEAISNQLVNIVVLAGQNSADMGSVLVGHLKATEETNFERIGVIGAPGKTVAEFMGHNLAEGRVVLVAPGIRNPDGSILPPAYTAAAVAGLIASFPVQTSLTNKPLNIPGIAVVANRGQQEQLIQRNVLTIVSKAGLRVLKGVTSAGVGEPFSAIPTRRIVDYAKYGVRSAANPYLGRLNNSRVRGALKATLDAFLTGMVQDEALTAYTLDVSATRAQEIAGQVLVVMTIQPTFSIDYIRVVMTLQ